MHERHRSIAHRLRRTLTVSALAAAALTPWAAQAQTKGAADLAAVPMVTEGTVAQSPWQRYKGWNKTTWDEYNSLAATGRTPKPPEQGALKPVALPLKGDAANGKKLAFDRSRGGGCLACHVMGPETAELPGNVGVDLSEIGATNPDAEYLFNYIWDPRVFNPESVMPPWGAHGFYNEQEVADMAAFLLTLKTPATFKNDLDDPAKRPLPVEDRDWADPFVNPAAEAFDTGPQLFAMDGPAGKSCASCHTDPDALKGWAAAMPKYHKGMDKMIGVEEFVARHAKATTGADWIMQSQENLHLSTWLRSLSNGMPLKVDVSSPGPKAAMARAEKMFNTKIGQLNFACVDCHGAEKGANKWIRGQYLGETAGQITHFPTWRTSRNEIWDIRKRLQWCNIQVRANELPPDAKEYADLELFVTAASNGMPMEAPGIRH